MYWASILGWLIPYLGGKVFVRALHFWAGVEFVAVFVLEFFDWLAKARWTATDSEFVRRLREYAANPKLAPPAETGFFNGGQKLYFWAVAVSAAVFLGTGLVWWYRKDLPHPLYAVCRTSHRVLGVAMSGALLIHIYKAALAEPGTLRSMITGTATEAWARERRPGWWRRLKGP
jgi:formate dehydrogenase subunit gamma